MARGELNSAFETAARERVDAVMIQPSLSTARAAELALAHRLPAASLTRVFVEAGGLMSYSANYAELWREMAVYVAKILKGAKPADLPVEQPTRFELVINLNTAKALGLTVPPSILARADEIIE
jgi:putative tryptophan/tyrosine transport system substrate-binding protein